MDRRNTRRTNGFQRPFNRAQVGTWALLPTLLVQFALFATPVLPPAAAVPCTICVFVCGALTVYHAYRCCSVDPIDERCAGEGGGAGGGDGDARFCWVCDAAVRATSVHCNSCNKCVEGFDHHCRWLNTCVGSANYDHFFRLVGSVLSMELVRGGALAGLVIAFFVERSAGTNGDGGSERRSDGWFGLDVGLAVAVVNATFLAVDVACIALLAQLFAFNVRLRRDGMTTYTYIVTRQQKNRERKRDEMELETRRIFAIRSAEQEGQFLKKWRLKAAGCPHVGELICRPCDPLPRAETNDNGEDQNAGEEMPPPCEESMHNEENAVQNSTANGDGNNDVADAKSTILDVESGIESISQTDEADSMPGVDETNDSIQAVERQNQRNRDIEASPLRAAIERRKSQQTLEEKPV